jgi:hypothetical protein
MSRVTKGILAQAFIEGESVTVIGMHPAGLDSLEKARAGRTRIRIRSCMMMCHTDLAGPVPRTRL